MQKNEYPGQIISWKSASTVLRLVVIVPDLYGKEVVNVKST